MTSFSDGIPPLGKEAQAKLLEEAQAFKQRALGDPLSTLKGISSLDPDAYGKAL